MAIDIGQSTPLLIGRGDGLALHLGESGEESRLLLPDRRASERHALIERHAAGYVLEDLDSTNGTFLRGVATKRVELQDGGTVVIGRTVLLFKRGVPNALLGGPKGLAAGKNGDVLETLTPSVFAGLDVIAKSAASRLPLILLGETGTGKELAARAAHRLSGRTGAFVAVNCGALPEALAESELFGHKKGAFSGAAKDHDGLVRASNDGTLFLDEIAELSAAVQVKLLRVLQEREVTPVGATRPEPVDFRLISASHQDLAVLVARGRFRADLLARLSGPQVTLPPLRERLIDLGLLVAVLLRRHAPANAAEFHFDRRVLDTLFAHPWPFNVRELDRFVEAAVTLVKGGGEITPEVLEHAPLGKPFHNDEASRESQDDLRHELVAHLTTHSGNVSQVARSMGRTRMQIHRWLKRWNLRLDDYRKR